MDRGIVVDHVLTPTAEIQICRLDLGDPGNPCLFVTAAVPRYEPLQGVPHRNDVTKPVLCDTPNIFFDDPAWPEFTDVKQLDEFIEKLQAQRAWLAETDPSAREEL